MSKIQIVGRVLLCAAFVAGSWEDILPGAAGQAVVGSVPSSDSPEEPGDAPLEPVLISELDVSVRISLQSQLFQNPAQQAPDSLVVRRIAHVPKPLPHL